MLAADRQRDKQPQFTIDISVCPRHAQKGTDQCKAGHVHGNEEVNAPFQCASFCQCILKVTQISFIQKAVERKCAMMQPNQGDTWQNRSSLKKSTRLRTQRQCINEATVEFQLRCMV